jgi:hypothetical protein
MLYDGSACGEQVTFNKALNVLSRSGSGRQARKASLALSNPASENNSQSPEMNVPHVVAESQVASYHMLQKPDSLSFN